MIGFLKGTIILIKDRFLLLEVNSIGYQIFMTSQMIEQLKIGASLSVFTQHQVREDSQELYGFQTWEELEFFQQLVSISGVGPKSALAVMSLAPLEEIKKAVVHGDPAILQRVSGVGKKTAERIIVELKEKIKFSTPLDPTTMTNVGDEQVMEALQSLGYRDRDIRHVLPQLPVEMTNVGERVKEALKRLSQSV